MEYFVGFLSALFLVYLLFKLQIKSHVILKNKIKSVRYSQSHIHVLVSPLLPKTKNFKKIVKSQSLLHESRFSIKVIIMDNKAYWIKDNIFYVADMILDGTVDKETTRRVDTMGMDKVQLDKMMFIVDKLREGVLDDSGGTRD